MAPASRAPRDAGLLLRKLESIADLSEDEKQAITGLPMTVRAFGPDTDIVQDGERPTESCLVLDGFGCGYKLLPSGKRQIVSVFVPGDIPDLQSLYLGALDHSLGTLVPTRAAFVSHHSLRDMMRHHPRLGEILWRETLIDAAILREWLIGIGRRSAHARIAHLLCELRMRFAAVGLSDDRRYDLPMTQAEIGDALGLSTVHVNRVLQDLRAAGLIVLHGSTLTIPNRTALEHAAGFDAAYLHQNNAERRGA